MWVPKLHSNLHLLSGYSSLLSVKNIFWFIFFGECWLNRRFCKLSVMVTSLKNSKFRGISNFRCLVARGYVLFSFSFFLSFFFFFLLLLSRMIFFSEFTCLLCICVIGGHELGTLSIRVHNSLTVHDNSWALKLDNFSEIQNVSSDNPLPPSVIITLCHENRYVIHP